MNRLIIFISSIVFLINSITLYAADLKPEDSSGGPMVRFNHLDGITQSQRVNARPGEVITVIVENTCPKKFNYELGGIVSLKPSDNNAFFKEEEACKLEPHQIVQTHTAQFGGYFLDVNMKQGVDSVAVENLGNGPKELKDVRYIIIVEDLGWDLAFAGGFTVSDLTDPKFAVKSDDADPNASSIFRDKSAEDSASLGLAAMIHVFHQKNPQWAFSFGLATGDSDDTAYLVGPSYRFGEKAAITLGYMWTSVDRLPAGVNIGDPLTDPNTLSNLQSRTEGGAFLSISYSFFSGVQGIFEKSFKGEEKVVKPSVTPADNGATDTGDDPPADT